MELSFRWYGETDDISLSKIKQIPGMKGIVTAIYDIPVGEVWPLEKIKKLQNNVSESGMKISVIESVPIHEDIKLGKETRDLYIDNYIETIMNLGELDIPVVCYNFMPIFDWLRTDLGHRLDDGSTALAYFENDLSNMDPRKKNLSLPGWDESYTKEDLNKLFEAYETVDSKKLMENYAYFIHRVAPAAEKANVKMALHPDDPSWGVFGLPRIVTDLENIKKLMSYYPGSTHGLCLCTGSLGVNNENDVVGILEYFLKENKVNFIHARNIKRLGKRNFTEVSHLASDGDVDMIGVVQKIVQYDYQGPIRPDHGRMIWGEIGRPGYGLYDRALGATYLNGLYDSFTRIVGED